MIKEALILISIFLSTVVFAQSTENELPEITIEADRTELKNASYIQLTPKRIERKFATDLGQIISVLPGVQIKNYGDIGGLKTVQFRSLGAAHTAIVYDQIGLSTALSGQIDLGNIPATFIQEIDLVYAGGTSLEIPVNAKMSSSCLLVKSRNQFFDTVSENVQIVGVHGGSYGLIEPSVFVKDKGKKLGITFSGRGRSFNGNYPFKYSNGSLTIHEKRQNAQMKDYSIVSTIQGDFSKHRIQLLGLNSTTDKGLPGSIVFYSNSNEQYLKTSTSIIALRHQFKAKKWSSFNQLNFQVEELNYIDSNYLNTLGYLHNKFFSTTYSVESQWKKVSLIQRFIPKFKDEILLGSSLITEKLKGNSLANSPLRTNFQGIVAYHINSFGKWNLQILSQQVFVSSSSNGLRFFPSMDWEYSLQKGFKVGVNARKTQRLPSFSELYYQQIGNDDLKPEKADLVSIRLAKIIQYKSIYSLTTIQGFYTHVRYKILAVPTKNLFIWSIQNIAKTESVGMELSESFRLKIKQSIIQLNGSYTYNYAIDISDKKSELYGGLLSYSPLNSFSSDLNFEFKKLAFTFGTIYQGWRYSLAENSYENFLPGFYVFNSSVNYYLRWNSSKLNCAIAVNNLFNTNYQYIRYFPMMGRVFQVKLIWSRVVTKNKN